jgi:photosystem II stability/assembly factor-like uncharacterized protein
MKLHITVNISSIDYSDSLNLYVAYLDAKGSELWHTRDGGKLWTKHLNHHGKDAGFGQLYFVNDSVGYMQDWGHYLYKTRNYGKDWNFITDLGSSAVINNFKSIDTFHFLFLWLSWIYLQD